MQRNILNIKSCQNFRTKTLETTSILTLSEALMCMVVESLGHRENQGQAPLYHSMVPSWLEIIPG